MNTAQLTSSLSVSGQLGEQDLGMAAAQGFRAFINNRPDGEADDQPSSAILAAAAERLGLAYRHIPVVSGRITDEDIAAFAKAFEDLEGPVLAFCRTGTRSTMLWALAEAGHLDPEEILKTASGAGYNLEALRPRLEIRARAVASAKPEGASDARPGGGQPLEPGAATSSSSRREHWHRLFTTKPETGVSWFQAVPETSLRLIRACRLPPDASLLDVGAGASRLPDALLAEGFVNLSVLDVAPAALDRVRARLPEAAGRIRFIVADIATWRPDLRVDLWHDRAVLHFLTDTSERASYADAVRQAVKPGGYVIISGFAPSGPERCSGLAVVRADAGVIAALLGPDFELLDSFEEDHETPTGQRQRFVFTRFRRARRTVQAHPDSGRSRDA